MTCDVDGIVTNPPYSEAARFIEHALALTKSGGGFVDVRQMHTFRAKGSAHEKDSVVRKFDRPASFNNAWYIWDWKYRGSPTLAYAQAQ